MLLHPNIYQLTEQGWAGSREHGVVYQQQSTLAAWSYCTLLANNIKGSKEWLRLSRGKRGDRMRSNTTTRKKTTRPRDGEGRKAHLEEASLTGNMLVSMWLQATHWISRACIQGNWLHMELVRWAVSQQFLKLQSVYRCRRYIWNQAS